MKPILKNLPPETLEKLVALCEELSYQEASRQACAQLGLQISPSTLCRLCTQHQIAEDQQTRQEYLTASGLDPSAIRNPKSAILDLAADQLQLRLLELASRPNPSASELRALFHIITRLEALKLSERRVVVAEKRETRMQQVQVQAQQPPAQKVVSQKEMQYLVRHLMGKEINLGDDDDNETKTPNQRSPFLHEITRT
jgi:hypothetical protein